MELWNKLKINPTNNRSKLIEAWNNLAPGEHSQELQLFVKANLDPYYHSFLKFYPHIEQLLPAGFFDDKHVVGQFEYHYDFFTTPVHKIVHNIKYIQALNHYDINKPFVVLLNTGSYSPLHIGHLQMMEVAKETLSPDYYVVGGYFSPSHDSYVSQKYEGTAKYLSDARISLCEEVVCDSDWLMIDPWEARYNDRAINFTDVIIRLKHYLTQHLQQPILIAYVFGSDNAGFSWAFVEQDISVCFERPGYHVPYEVVKNDPLLKNNRHFFIDNQGNHYSSKAIREGKYEFLPEKIKQLYFQYQNEQYPVHIPIYLLRDDRKFATSHYKKEMKTFHFYEELEHFYRDLKSIIKEAFLPYCHMQVVSLSVEQQNEYLNNISGNIINLDGCTHHPKQISIGVSRLFALSDGQVYAPKLINRPGTPSLNEQISYAIEKNYKIVDDDIASGRTIQLIRELLPKQIQIEEYIALSQQSFHDFFDYDMSYNFHDIVDFRDFLVGSHDGGLVVELPNGVVARAPYIFPYVSLSHRAKIPHKNQMKMSLKLWKLNAYFFKQLPICIKDSSLEFQQLAYYLGFKATNTLYEFCEFHIHKLEKLCI